jgi:hypothetical protein
MTGMSLSSSNKRFGTEPIILFYCLSVTRTLSAQREVQKKYKNDSD